MYLKLTSYLQKHQLLVLQRFRNIGRFSVAVGIALLGIFFSDSTHAAVFTVNSASDVSDANPGNGICETATGNGSCTLRAAVQETNALAGTDEIILPPNNYALTIVNELVITSSLTITGGNAATTIIDGNKNARPNSRVFSIGSGITVTITGVRIRNGGTSGVGGGIFNSGTLVLSNSIVSENNADHDGGAIYNISGGTAILTNIMVSGNNAGVDGGGIFSGGTLTLAESVVTGNTAGDDAGGIFNITGGTMTLSNSTISGNSAGDGGGGIRNSGTLTLTNCTVSGNNSGQNGGGIYNFLGTTQSFNSTITNNRSDADLNGTGVGGGIHNDPAATFTFQNTILAGNFETQLSGSAFVVTIGECDGTIVSVGNNLMQNFETSHCAVIGNVLLADPKLSPLPENGGPTQTHALLAGSPAIDAGNPNGCLDSAGALLQTDQRGLPRVVDGNGDGRAICDIGAFELNGDTISPTRLSNISTRSDVLTGDNVMIGGFIIDGPVPKRVLVRSRGPSMSGAPFFMPGTLSNPLVQLFSGQTLIAQNDNWQDPPNCPGFTCNGSAEILRTGLDPCQPNPGQTASPPNCALEAGILITLSPGAYTAIVRGADGGTGIGLMEVFEADSSTVSELSNISTRAFVQSGDNVMIGGLIIEGGAQPTVLIRARGPSMSGAPFFVPGTLSNPLLQLFSGQTLIAQNDNWQDAPSCGSFVCGTPAQIAVSGLDPCQPNPGQSTSPIGCAQEAAILISLPPGAYTAIVRGVGDSTGVGLVEVFH